MDPLEWSVRRVVSIPQKYYWETGNYAVGFRTKIWHRTVGTLGFTLRVAEKVGEVLANITGINSSRYDYVTSTMTDEEWELARKRADTSRARRKEKRQEAAKKTHSLQIV